ncbi:hypothetical protein J3A78_005688 [Streptomyces sp. PvR006]|nr:hypothetical protein [Streptomyces sp. PvR006]
MAGTADRPRTVPSGTGIVGAVGRTRTGAPLSMHKLT